MHTLPHSVPLTLKQATTDPHLSQRLTGKSGSVSCGVTMHTRFYLGPQESVSLVLCKVWQLYVGLMAIFSKRAYAIPRSVAHRASDPAAGHC